MHWAPACPTTATDVACLPTSWSKNYYCYSISIIIAHPTQKRRAVAIALPMMRQPGAAIAMTLAIAAVQRGEPSMTRIATTTRTATTTATAGNTAGAAAGE